LVEAASAPYSYQLFSAGLTSNKNIEENLYTEISMSLVN